jgi:hypothetical protein
MPCSARYLPFIGTLSIGLLAASSLPTLADTLMIQGSTTFNSSLFKPYLANIETAAGHTLAVVPNKSSEGHFSGMETGTGAPGAGEKITGSGVLVGRREPFRSSPRKRGPSFLRTSGFPLAWE